MRPYPGLIPALAELVAIPSVSSTDTEFDSSNAAMIHKLAEWFENMGAKIELMPVSNNPEKLNMIASFKQGCDGLVLAGHTDTVPYDEEYWQTDPFKLTENKQCLFGLGVTDMKCFFPLVLEAISQIDLKKLQRPLVILATADEESNMTGAQILAQQFIEQDRQLARHALIGEPTGLKPIHMHKGIITEHIYITGQAGHSSNPALGNNALDGMYRVMQALMQWRDKLAKQYYNDNFNVPIPTMNFGSIHGGDNPNRICPNCELSLDVRMMPGMQIDNIRTEIRHLVQESIIGSGLKVHFNNHFCGISAMHTEKSSQIVTLAEEFSGYSSEAVNFATEAPFLNQIGCETIILGPGDIDVAHQSNEYLPMKRLQPMITILQKLIQQLL